MNEETNREEPSSNDGSISQASGTGQRGRVFPASSEEGTESRVQNQLKKKGLRIKADIDELRQEFDNEILSPIERGMGLVDGIFVALKCAPELRNEAIMAIAIPHIQFGAFIAKKHPELIEINEIEAKNSQTDRHVEQRMVPSPYS